MIIIKVKKNNHLFRYGGDVKITIDEDFVFVESDFLIRSKDELTLGDGHTWDTFYKEDIVSIEGK